jgi:hypothetical protein
MGVKWMLRIPGSLPNSYEPYRYNIDMPFRLHREFAARVDHLPSTRFSVSDAERADYMNVHAPKPKPGASAYRKDQES